MKKIILLGLFSIGLFAITNNYYIFLFQNQYKQKTIIHKNFWKNGLTNWKILYKKYLNN